MLVILIIGMSGFISANLVMNILKRSKAEAVRLVGIDNLNELL